MELNYKGTTYADTRFHDGALPIVSGACHIQVMRANREHPELSQGTDYTYNHAPMLCRWHGNFYLLYLSSPVHEHDGLANALLMTSPDGFTWSKPRISFPSLPVPQGVYQGRGADHLSKDAMTVVHHRMGFYRASNDVLLVMTYHGVSPDIHIAPNSGYGMGRVVRRVLDNQTLGPIHVLRVNTQAGWKCEHFPYPWFEDSDDTAFVEACKELLSDTLANGAWWEEECLDKDFFPLSGIKAPSFLTMDDGSIAAIGKAALSSVSTDGGQTWSKPKKAPGIISSGGKCALTRTGDNKTAILYNPSADGQHRWPLAVITSEDGYTYQDMLCAGGEVAPMRYGGYLKNFGLNYIRAIMPGNDDAPDGYTWLTYSMNKEDIWVLRLPMTITGSETEPVDDDFSTMSGLVPEKWHTYSPRWAKVCLKDQCLVLHDSEPYDYAKAMRLFPRTTKAAVRINLTPVQGKNGELQIELSDQRSLPAFRILLTKDGEVLVRGGNGIVTLGRYENEQPLELLLEADCRDQVASIALNGADRIRVPFMCPTLTVERLTLRTGDVRIWPTPEDNLKNVFLPDLENPGDRLPEAIYKVHRVTVSTKEP